VLGRSAAWRRMALTEIMNSLSKFGPAAYSTSPLSLSLSLLYWCMLVLWVALL
jgi:hypothetical protein